MKINSLFGLAATLVCALAGAAESVDESSTPEAALENIIVTARRIEENAQNIPVAISTFNAAELRQRGVSDIADLSGKTPSLTVDYSAPISGASNAAAIYLRGIGQSDFLLTNDPAVGVYLDDIYIARSVGAILSLTEVERVEVLRGPQGVFFGRNTIGGAINVTTKKPSGSFGGRISLKVGEDGREDFGLGVDVPIIHDQLTARASFNVENRDGYITRVFAGDRLGNRNRDGAFINLEWTASDQLQLRWLFDYVSI